MYNIHVQHVQATRRARVLATPSRDLRMDISGDVAQKRIKEMVTENKVITRRHFSNRGRIFLFMMRGSVHRCRRLVVGLSVMSSGRFEEREATMSHHTWIALKDKMIMHGSFDKKAPASPRCFFSCMVPGASFHEGQPNVPPVRLQQHGSPDFDGDRLRVRGIRRVHRRGHPTGHQGLQRLAHNPAAVYRRGIHRRWVRGRS